MENFSENNRNLKAKKTSISGEKCGRSLILVILVMLVTAMIILTSGCIHMTENIKVSSNGDINYMKLSMTTTPLMYNMLTENVQNEGFSGLQEYIKSVNPEATYNEDWGDNEVTITIELKEGVWVPLGNSKTRITDDGSTITYLDQSFINEEGFDQDLYNTGMYSGLYDAMLKSVRIDIYLEMPGEIIDTNAQYVDENKAEWHLDGMTMRKTEIYAKSKKGLFTTPEIIIFGVCIILVAIVIGLLIRKRSRQRRMYY